MRPPRNTVTTLIGSDIWGRLVTLFIMQHLTVLSTGCMNCFIKLAEIAGVALYICIPDLADVCIFFP